MNITAHRVSATGIGGGLAVVLVYIIELTAEIKIPGEVVAAGSVLLSSIVAGVWSALGPDRIELED